MDGGYRFVSQGKQFFHWLLGKGRETSPAELHNSDVPRIPSRAPNVVRSIHDVRTLEDCLIFFSLPEILSELDGSLERVRKCQDPKEGHEAYSKQIDKTLQRKSFQYHPDRVSNRGGTLDELLEAQRAQTAINATRTVLNALSQDFLVDLDIDHKYKFYAKLELNSLGNEEEIKRHIKHVLHKTVWLSEIKQVHIIAQIRMFLSESRLSLQSYIERNLSQFEMHQDYALYHLDKCIDGYDKLLTEFKIISEECRKESLIHIGSVVKEIEIKSITESQTLKSLKDVSKLSLAGQFQVFSRWTDLDDYLVLPFVYYVNAMLMCSLMQSEKHKKIFNILSYQSTRKGYIFLNEKNDLEIMLDHATKLAYKLYSEYHSKPLNIDDERKAIEESIKMAFDNLMKDIKDELENRFKIEAYVEGGNQNFISRKCSNFMSAAKDIGEIVHNLFKDMENCKTMNEEVRKKYDHAVKPCGFEKNIEECLEQSKVLHEEVSRAFMKSHPIAATDEVKFAKGSDDIRRFMAESLQHSNLLHEEVSKILNTRIQESIKIVSKCEETTEKLDSDITESIERTDFLHEQVLAAIQKEKREMESVKENGVDDADDLNGRVDNEFVSLNVSEESQTSGQNFVEQKASPMQVKYSMADTERKPSSNQVLQQTENFVGVPMEVDNNTDECSDENTFVLGEFHPEHLITEKPYNEGLKLFGNESLIEEPVLNQETTDETSSFTRILFKLDNKDERHAERCEQDPVFAQQFDTYQMLNEDKTSFVEDTA